jgi:predicted component of type VI protein secretion system
VHEISTDVVNIGRFDEVRGRDHRPVRRNHLHFGDAEPSVSRQHAHIRYVADSGEFRIFDDRSARGTRLFSNGEAIDVPPGRSRGARLHSGDEIHFGTVGVRFEMDAGRY